MFERFTDRARRAVVLATDDARMLHHNYIGTEHILLGLIHEGEGVAAQALQALDISLAAVRQQVEEIIGQGQQAPPGHIPFTPRAKKVLELSLREALQLNHNYIGTEHILLGLIREGEGVAAQVLVRLGADLGRVRQQVIQLLHGDQELEEAGLELDEAGLEEAEPEEAEPERSGSRLGAGRRERRLLYQVASRLEAIESRLSAVEQRVGTGPDPGDLDRDIARVRRDKEAAVSAQDYEHAAALRNREKQLLAEKAAHHQQREAAHQDLPSLAQGFRRLSEEVERLGALLRGQGTEPQGGGP